MFFDADGVGTIDRSQVDNRMKTGTRNSEASKGGIMSKTASQKETSSEKNSGTQRMPGMGTMSAFLTQERMDEMDWDKDGTITFKVRQKKSLSRVMFIWPFFHSFTKSVYLLFTFTS